MWVQRGSTRQQLHTVAIHTRMHAVAGTASTSFVSCGAIQAGIPVIGPVWRTARPGAAAYIFGCGRLVVCGGEMTSQDPVTVEDLAKRVAGEQVAAG